MNFFDELMTIGAAASLRRKVSKKISFVSFRSHVQYRELQWTRAEQHAEAKLANVLLKTVKEILSFLRVRGVF